MSLTWALLMTLFPCMLLVASLLRPALVALSPVWFTATSIVVGMGTGIAWYTWDRRRTRQWLHLEAFWRAYRQVFPEQALEQPDTTALLERLKHLHDRERS